MYNYEVIMSDDDVDIPISFDKTETTLTTDNKPLNYVGSFGTVMNLLNTLMGAGVLGISDTFRFCGFIPSFLLQLFIAVLSYVTTVMVVRLQTKLHVNSFDEMASKTLGKFATGIYGISADLFCLAALTAYIIIGLNTVLSWLDYLNIKISPSAWQYKLFVLIYALIVPVGLTIPKNASFLSIFSTFSILCLFMFVFFMFYQGFKLLPSAGIEPTVVLARINAGFFNSLAVYSLTFSLALVVIPVIGLSKPSFNTRSIIIGITFIICFICVSIPGIIGYLIFGDHVKPCILESFSTKDPLTVIVRAAFFVVVNASYPVITLTVAGSISRVIFGVDNSTELPWPKRSLILFSVSFIPVFVAMFLPNIRPALSIGGALGGCLGNFVYPAWIWIKVSQNKLTHWTNILCMLLMIFGAFSTVIATYESVLDAIKQFKHK